MTDRDTRLTDLTLERDVLGEMLAFGVYGAYVAESLSGAEFSLPEHRMVFEAIAVVEQRGETPDLVSVGRELRHRGWMDQVQPGYFTRLVDGVPRPAPENISAAAHALLDLTTRRHVDRGAGRLRHEVQTQPDALRDGTVAQQLADLEALVARGTAGQSLLTAALQVQALTTDVARDKDALVFLGLPTLDQALDGLRAGEVLGLMARPGIGKTVTVCHVTRAVADLVGEGGHVCFSLEMPAAQIVGRLAQIVYGYGRHELRDRIAHGMFHGDEYQRIFERLVIVDTPGLSVADMQTRLRHAQLGPLKGMPIRLVTIDHLGLIGGDRRMTVYDRVSTQARELKELAKRLNTVVLLVIQVNRDAGGDGSRDLGLGAARDSGVVEEAMDYLLALRRPEYSPTLTPLERARYRDVLLAKIVKNRHGVVGKELALRLDPRNLRLTEDPDFEIDEADIAKIAAAGGRRR